MPVVLRRLTSNSAVGLIHTGGNVANLRFVTDLVYDRFDNPLTATVSGAKIETREVANVSYHAGARTDDG